MKHFSPGSCAVSEAYDRLVTQPQSPEFSTIEGLRSRILCRVTAAYLACKVEEFNVSLEQFVANINGNKERAMEVILNHELLVMETIFKWL